MPSVVPTATPPAAGRPGDPRCGWAPVGDRRSDRRLGNSTPIPDRVRARRPRRWSGPLPPGQHDHRRARGASPAMIVERADTLRPRSPPAYGPAAKAMWAGHHDECVFTSAGGPGPARAAGGGMNPPIAELHGRTTRRRARDTAPDEPVQRDQRVLGPPLPIPGNDQNPTGTSRKKPIVHGLVNPMPRPGRSRTAGRRRVTVSHSWPGTSTRMPAVDRSRRHDEPRRWPPASEGPARRRSPASRTLDQGPPATSPTTGPRHDQRPEAQSPGPAFGVNIRLISASELGPVAAPMVAPSTRKRDQRRTTRPRPGGERASSPPPSRSGTPVGGRAGRRASRRWCR